MTIPSLPTLRGDRGGVQPGSYQIPALSQGNSRTCPWGPYAPHCSLTLSWKEPCPVLWPDPTRVW